MVVKLLLKLLEKYSLCTEQGIQIQFVTHKKDTWWNDEIYEDCILVTPYDKDGNLNHYRSRYFHDVKFSSWKKRSSFYELMKLYNKKNRGKKNFVPLHFGVGVPNYCTIV